MTTSEKISILDQMSTSEIKRIKKMLKEFEGDTPTQIIRSLSASKDSKMQGIFLSDNEQVFIEAVNNYFDGQDEMMKKFQEAVDAERARKLNAEAAWEKNYEGSAYTM